MLRRFLPLFLALIMAAAPATVFADSISNPPGAVREYSVTATTASATVTLASGVIGQSINVVNDGAVTVYVTLTNTASATPTNGDQFFSVHAGESRSLDVQFYQFAYIAASSTCAIRVTVLSQN